MCLFFLNSQMFESFKMSPYFKYCISKGYLYQPTSIRVQNSKPWPLFSLTYTHTSLCKALYRFVQNIWGLFEWVSLALTVLSSSLHSLLVVFPLTLWSIKRKSVICFRSNMLYLEFQSSSLEDNYIHTNTELSVNNIFS